MARGQHHRPPILVVTWLCKKCRRTGEQLSFRYDSRTINSLTNLYTIEEIWSTMSAPSSPHRPLPKSLRWSSSCFVVFPLLAFFLLQNTPILAGPLSTDADILRSTQRKSTEWGLSPTVRPGGPHSPSDRGARRPQSADYMSSRGGKQKAFCLSSPIRREQQSIAGTTSSHFSVDGRRRMENMSWDDLPAQHPQELLPRSPITSTIATGVCDSVHDVATDGLAAEDKSPLHPETCWIRPDSPTPTSTTTKPTRRPRADTEGIRRVDM